MPRPKISPADNRRSPSKRKARVVSDSSIEVVDAPAPSHPKKRQANSKTKPATGDQALYNMLPMNSVEEQLDALLGTTDVVAETADTPHRPSRVRTKTEKAKLLEESPIPFRAVLKPTPRATAKAKTRTLSPAVAVDSEDSDDDFPPYPIPKAFDTSKPSAKKMTTPKFLGKRDVSSESDQGDAGPGDAATGDVIDNESAGDESAEDTSTVDAITKGGRTKGGARAKGIEATTPKFSSKRDVSSESDEGNTGPGATAAGDMVDDGSADGEIAKDMSTVDAIAKRGRTQGSVGGIVAKIATSHDSEINQRPMERSLIDSAGLSVLSLGSTMSDNDSANDDDMSTAKLETPANEDPIDLGAVMCKGLQDPVLYRIYEHLPTLGPFRDAHAFKPVGDVERIQFSTFCRRLSQRSIANFVRALLFVAAAPFVNTSRVDPARLSADSGRIVMAGGKTNMVGIMSGALKECYITREYRGGSPTTPYIIHRVTIVPLPQEMRRDSTVWGQVLGYEKIVASMSQDGISFHTRPQANSVIPTSPQTPAKSRAGYFMTASSPSTFTSRNDAGVGKNFFPASRAFEDQIPIYDGRGKKGDPFTFSDIDFRQLHTFPLYRGGREDIKSEAIVAVGYTVNLYPRTIAGVVTNQLSTNLQFLILLGMTIPEVE